MPPNPSPLTAHPPVPPQLTPPPPPTHPSSSPQALLQVCLIYIILMQGSRTMLRMIPNLKTYTNLLTKASYGVVHAAVLRLGTPPGTGIAGSGMTTYMSPNI